MLNRDNGAGGDEKLIEDPDHTEVGKKVLELYKAIEDVTVEHLQKFSYSELCFIQENYGLGFVYPVFKDISEILREPARSDVVH